MNPCQLLTSKSVLLIEGARYDVAIHEIIRGIMGIGGFIGLISGLNLNF